MARMPNLRRVVSISVLVLCASTAVAQDSASRAGLWDLFAKSFDLFSVTLILGSILAVTLIVRSIRDARRSVLIPTQSIGRLEELAAAGRIREMIEFARKDRSIPSRVVFAAAETASGTPEAIREHAEVVAGEQCAHWYRRVEPLNLIGNLGPLVGLAGTVWGMILAFQGLGAAGGQANPGVLSLGISKALFHTLLGLLLAIPSLAAYSVLRGRVDRYCNEAMVISTRLVDILIRHQTEEANAAASPKAPTKKRSSDAA